MYYGYLTDCANLDLHCPKDDNEIVQPFISEYFNNIDKLKIFLKSCWFRTTYDSEPTLYDSENKTKYIEKEIENI
jgi:hypothetical protein